MVRAMLVTGKSHKVTLAELKTLPAPPVLGGRHKPVPHYELVDEVTAKLAIRGYRIVKQEFAVQRTGAQFFGVLQVEGGDLADVGLDRPGQDFALGLRSANDRKMRLQMCVGVVVFADDTLAFSADALTLNRKHTLGIDLGKELSGGLDRFAQTMQNFIALQDRARTLRLPQQMAKTLIYDVFAQGIVPHRCFPAVHENYFAPSGDTTVHGTLWSLHGAFAKEVRDLVPSSKFKATVALGRLLAGKV